MEENRLIVKKMEVQGIAPATDETPTRYSGDALARLFFGTLMVMAAAIGVLGVLLRTLSSAAS